MVPSSQAEIFAWLEEKLYVLEIPFVSRPGDFNSQRINHLTDESIPRQVRPIARGNLTLLFPPRPPPRRPARPRT